MNKQTKTKSYEMNVPLMSSVSDVSDTKIPYSTNSKGPGRCNN